MALCCADAVTALYLWKDILTLYCQDWQTISLAARSLARRRGSRAAAAFARAPLSLLLGVPRERPATWRVGRPGQGATGNRAARSAQWKLHAAMCSCLSEPNNPCTTHAQPFSQHNMFRGLLLVRAQEAKVPGVQGCAGQLPAADMLKACCKPGAVEAVAPPSVLPLTCAFFTPPALGGLPGPLAAFLWLDAWRALLGWWLPPLRLMRRVASSRKVSRGPEQNWSSSDKLAAGASSRGRGLRMVEDAMPAWLGVGATLTDPVFVKRRVQTGHAFVYVCQQLNSQGTVFRCWVKHIFDMRITCIEGACWRGKARLWNARDPLLLCCCYC